MLQQNSNLSTTNWSTLTNIPVLNLTNLQYQVNLPSSNGSGFFRLAAGTLSVSLEQSDLFQLRKRIGKSRTFLFDRAAVGAEHERRMDTRTLTLGHSPDPDDAFMFYSLAKELIPSHGYKFEHILQDIQTLNERATRGELDISAISIHAYAYVSDKYALLPSGASMGDGYGPMLVAKQKLTRAEIAR